MNKEQRDSVSGPRPPQPKKPSFVSNDGQSKRASTFLYVKYWSIYLLYDDTYHTVFYMTDQGSVPIMSIISNKLNHKRQNAT
jgi:hypothetical protein